MGNWTPSGNRKAQEGWILNMTHPGKSCKLEFWLSNRIMKCIVTEIHRTGGSLESNKYFNTFLPAVIILYP